MVTQREATELYSSLQIPAVQGLPEEKKILYAMVKLNKRGEACINWLKHDTRAKNHGYSQSPGKKLNQPLFLHLNFPNCKIRG